jgi:hypothetical protein
MAEDQTKATPKRRDAVVFIDIESYFRGTRECFGARVPDVNIQVLAEELAKLSDVNLVRAYSYLVLPPRGGCPDRNNMFDRVIECATAPWSTIRVYDEHPMPRLSFRDDGAPGPAVRVLDHSDVMVGMAVDAVNELFSYEADSFLFVSREHANARLASRLHEITKQERTFVHLRSATCYNAELKPPIINGTDWLYITQEMYEAARLRPEGNT